MYSAEQLMQIMLQGVPEYYGSKQRYQPTDVGSEIANMSLLEDQMNMAANPLFAILNGTFDYDLLEPVSSFDKEPPNTALLDQYTESGLLDSLLIALQEGYLPEQAAIAQYNAEFPNGEDAISDERGQLLKGEDANPRYKALLETAKSLAPEVAEIKQYERQRANATFEPSEMGKTLEAMGISSERTPDSHFSDNIEELNEDAFNASTEMGEAQKAWDLIGKELVGDTDPFGGAKGLSVFDEPTRSRPGEATIEEMDPVTGVGLSRPWSQSTEAARAEYDALAAAQGADFALMSLGLQVPPGDERPPPKKDGYVPTVMQSPVYTPGDENLTFDVPGREPPKSRSLGQGGNWRAMDRQFEDSLENRKATPAERAAIRRASDKEYDAYQKQRREQRAIDRERSSGRTIQRDQAMAMLANMFMRR